MFVSSCAPVTLLKALRLLFHFLKGLSVRMEQATASSNAMEIQLQELRSNTLTRDREWLQGALEGISVLELRKMASARNVGRGPDKKWPAVGELRIQLLEVLAPATEVGCIKKRVFNGSCFFSGSQQLMEVLVPPKEAWMRQNVSDPKLNVVTWCNVVG